MGLKHILNLKRYRLRTEAIEGKEDAGDLLHLRPGLRDGLHRHPHPTVREEMGRSTAKTSG